MKNRKILILSLVAALMLSLCCMFGCIFDDYKVYKIGFDVEGQVSYVFVLKNKLPEYSGATPEKAATADKEYVFKEIGRAHV